MSSCEKSTEQPIAAEGGLERTPEDSRCENPYAVLDDLMTVIEVLCPRWPEREPPLKDGKFVL